MHQVSRSISPCSLSLTCIRLSILLKVPWFRQSRNRVQVHTGWGRPRKRCRKLVADKGYDAEPLRQYCDRYRMQPVIPYRAMKRKPKPGLPRLLDKPKYRDRNAIERLFGWLKEHRRLATRYCKLATSYAAMVTLACCRRCLHLISYSA